MTNVWLIYGTTEGQTRKIVEAAAETIRSAGHRAEIVPVEEAGEMLEEASPDGVLVANSVHMGKHSPAVRRFIEAHRDYLTERPSAFVSVSLNAAPGQKRPEALALVDDFLKEVAWTPAQTGVVAGALRYSRYGFLMRLIMKRIARKEGLPTDTKQDYEFTDWAEVDRFTREFLGRVTRDAAVASPPDA